VFREKFLFAHQAVCVSSSLIVCLREYLMLQFIGEKEKEKKEEILVIAFGDSFPLIPQFS